MCSFAHRDTWAKRRPNSPAKCSREHSRQIIHSNFEHILLAPLKNSIFVNLLQLKKRSVSYQFAMLCAGVPCAHISKVFFFSRFSQPKLLNCICLISFVRRFTQSKLRIVWLICDCLTLAPIHHFNYISRFDFRCFWWRHRDDRTIGLYPVAE